jgi:hypothetical protein
LLIGDAVPETRHPPEDVRPARVSGNQEPLGVLRRCHPRRLGTFSQAFAEHVWSERLDDPNPFVDSFDCDKAPPITLPSARTYVRPAAPGNRGVRLELQA